METSTDVRDRRHAASSRPQVHGFLDEDSQDWSRYVAAHDDSSIFHTLRWRDALRHTFKHRDKYLVARRDGEISGVLPLVHVSSLLFGTTLISVPFGVYGGLLVDDEESARALIEHAGALAREVGAKYVELRHQHPPVDDLPRNDLYYTFIDDVPQSEEDCLKRIPRKARAEVRKALKDEDLRCEIGNVDLGEFHRLFSINKRKLGSPLFPSSLFWHLREGFGDDCMLMAVKRGGRTIAAVMSFIYKDTVMPYYSGTAPGAESHRASNFMYYKLMVWASERGLGKFDFGRSREGTGAFSFKKHQGFTPTPLSYDYILNTAEELPALNPSNPKYRAARRVFQTMPMWLALKVGSWLAKRAPF